MSLEVILGLAVALALGHVMGVFLHAVVGTVATRVVYHVTRDYRKRKFAEQYKQMVAHFETERARIAQKIAADEDLDEDGRRMALENLDEFLRGKRGEKRYELLMAHKLSEEEVEE